MSGTTTRTRTLGTIVEEVRTLLQDKLPTSGGALRYADDEHVEAINAWMAEIRTKRPDIFLRAFGRKSLRQPLPYYSAARDMNLPFPLDISVYNTFVWYVAGRAELREDTFSDDSRAVTLLNKALTSLLTTQS
jgi:hypothetical protein